MSLGTPRQQTKFHKRTSSEVLIAGDCLEYEGADIGHWEMLRIDSISARGGIVFQDGQDIDGAVLVKKHCHLPSFYGDPTFDRHACSVHCKGTPIELAEFTLPPSS